MALGDEYDDLPDNKVPGLNSVSGQKSFVTKMAAEKKSAKENFEDRVNQHQQQQSDNSKLTNELVLEFEKIMSDQTLAQHKNVFSNDIERNFLKKLVDFADKLNNDEDEKESIGSLIVITILLKNCMKSRNRLNSLEYEVQELKKKLNDR